MSVVKIQQQLIDLADEKALLTWWQRAGQSTSTIRGGRKRVQGELAEGKVRVWQACRRRRALCRKEKECGKSIGGDGESSRNNKYGQRAWRCVRQEGGGKRTTNPATWKEQRSGRVRPGGTPGHAVGGRRSCDVRASFSRQRVGFTSNRGGKCPDEKHAFESSSRTQA